MAVDAIIMAIADLGAEAVVADAVMGAVAETVVADAVGTVVADGLVAGLTDAAIAGAADLAGATAAETALAGFGADAATAAGIDAAAEGVAGAIIPEVDATGLTILDEAQTADLMKNIDPNLINSLQPIGEAGAAEAGAAPALEGYDAAMADLAASQGAVTPALEGVDAAMADLAAGQGTTAPALEGYDAAMADVANAGGAVTPDGLPPVEDAVPSWVNPNPTPDPTLGTALKDYAGAVADTLGPAGLIGAGAVGAGLLSDALTPKLTGQVGSGGVNYEWGQGTPLVDPGLNPGFVGYAASMPDYHSTNPTDAQYYWGVHAPVNTAADLANYNQLPPGAPTTPWGAGMGGHGATPGYNPADFVNQYILNPAWAGVMNATAPGYTAPGPAVPATQP